MRLRTEPARRPWTSTWLVFCIVVGAARQGDAVSVEPGPIVLTGRVVDETGSPAAGASVTPTIAGATLAPLKTDKDGTFQVAFPPSASGRIAGSFLARGSRDRLGFLAITLETPEPLTIRLKPARALEVLVVDRDRKPVEAAEVGFCANLTSLMDGRTGADGRWRAMVPVSLPVLGSRMTPTWCVYALKSRTGFDYATSERSRGSVESPIPLPEALTLTLDGARAPVRVKAVDIGGQPLAGVTIYPWIVDKPGHEASANLAGAIRTRRETGRDGVVTFDWLPSEINRPISMASRAPNSYPADGAFSVSAKASDQELTVPHFPYERLSGRVVAPDGQPAAGATVVLQGQGAGRTDFRGETRTDSDGRYAIRVYSEQAYIINATQGDLAAISRSSVVVRAGKPVEGVNLVLGRATRVRGRVTAGDAREPIANSWVSAITDRGPIPDELTRKGVSGRFMVNFQLGRYTDEEGRFEFRLGPGDYRIQVSAPGLNPRVEPIELAIPTEDPPAEVVRDIAIKESAPGTAPFRAMVVDAEGRPAAGAVVTGMYAATSPREWIKRTNAEGIVELPRFLIPMVIHAETSDKGRAGIARVKMEREATVVVKPLASASGRLIGPDGKPVARRELNYAIRVPRSTPARGPSSWECRGVTTTDDQGRFLLTGLVAGERYVINVYNPEDRRRSAAETNVTANGPETLALGDVTIDLSPPRPYVPPTPAERSAAAFAVRTQKTPRDKAKQMIADAQLEYTRPMILFGAPTEPACIDVFRLLHEPPTKTTAERDGSPSAFRGGYTLLSLDTTQPDVAVFAGQLGVPGVGKTPSLAVLSQEGTLMATYPLGPGGDGKLDPSALAAFLREHKLPTRDATRLLAEGLAKATAEDKRLFLILSSAPCPPCLRLAHFVSASRAELERHYVFVTLDVGRDEHAPELDRRYRGDNDDGAPWYAILDASGKLLITSNSDELKEEHRLSNIGFPSSSIGIDHLMRMFRETAPRLTPEALATLREGLAAKP